MTSRLNDRDLDRVLGAWLDEGPTSAADAVLEQVMARVPTARRRAAWWPQLPSALRTHGPLLASLAVLVLLTVGLVLAIATLTAPPGPPPSPPVIPTVQPTSVALSEEPSPSASPRPVAARGSFEISTPSGSVPGGRTWPFNGTRSERYAEEGLIAYQFTYGCCGALEFYVNIYLDPTVDWVGSWDTTRDDLTVLIGYQLIASETVGTYVSDAGECEVTFDEFSTTAAHGSFTCIDVPGHYSSRTDPVRKEGVTQMAGSFAFNPGYYLQFIESPASEATEAPSAESESD